MKLDFIRAMREATQFTRRQELPEAMRAIRNALGMFHPADTKVRERAEQSGGVRIREDATERGEPSIRTRPHSRPLADTLRALRLGRQSSPAARRRPVTNAPPVVDGARFLTRSFVCPQGERAYKVYLPRRPARGLPLVVMLHGCTQTADDFATGTRMNALAEEIGFVVAYPSQSKTANQSLCWNWFQLRDIRRGGGEAAIIAGISKYLVGEYSLDAERVFVAGMSAGGAMAAVLASEYPDIYAAVGIHSGLAAGSANDLVSAFAAMRGDHHISSSAKGRRIPTIAFHGAGDSTVHPSNADRVKESSLRAGDTAETVAATIGGRRVARTVARDQQGVVWLEEWRIDSAGHAWSGGDAAGSFTDSAGPDASREMVRYFLETAKSP